MKLLIVCQALDQNHPILGFFHRWVEEFAKHVEHIHVIASHVGKYDVPENVTVHSLGKEIGTSKFYKIRKLKQLSWKLRNEYDVVFVHMIPEFVLVAGLLWRTLNKKIALWYTHKHVGARLWLAEKIVHKVFTASKASFRLSSKKLHILGHGIDTHFFTPSKSVVREERLLSVGRLMRSKRHDLVIQAAKESGKGLHIVGNGEERGHLELLAERVGADVSFRGALPQKDLVTEYQKAHALIHTSETGSLDKVVLEALACGCPVITTDEAMKDMPVVITTKEPNSIAKSLTQVSTIEPEVMHQYVVTGHSLQNLVKKIRDIF